MTWYGNAEYLVTAAFSSQVLIMFGCSQLFRFSPYQEFALNSAISLKQFQHFAQAQINSSEIISIR